VSEAAAVMNLPLRHNLRQRAQRRAANQG